MCARMWRKENSCPVGGKQHGGFSKKLKIELPCVHAKALQLCSTLATPWTGACQAPLLMEFSRQEYWSGLRFPIPGDLSDPWIEPMSHITCIGTRAL